MRSDNRWQTVFEASNWAKRMYPLTKLPSLRGARAQGTTTNQKTIRAMRTMTMMAISAARAGATSTRPMSVGGKLLQR
jgi:hypothetical protein